MKNKFLISGALGFLLTVLLAVAVPVRADDVDQRIRSLEDELARLKSEQTHVKAEQIELRNYATSTEKLNPWLATLYLAMDDPSLFTDSFLFPRSRKLPNCRCDP